MTPVSSRRTVSGLTIANGQYVTIVAITPPTIIGDRVWVDSDQDGIQDSAESGLAGVSVKLRQCPGYSVGADIAFDYN